MRLFLLGTAALVLIAADAPKQDVMLSPADLDPAMILPPPPAENSQQAKVELDELHAVEAVRTAEMMAVAEADSENKTASIFSNALGPKFDLAKLPTTARLMLIVRATEKDAANRAKDHFHRNRPWVIMPDIKGCEHGDDKPQSSYPSGHTTMGYSMGAILARLVPERGEAIMLRAVVYGESRIICESHYRSDVSAGETLGMIVAEKLMQKPAFRKIFDAADKELRVAGIM
jgi:acid phosphatase (class A)